MRAWIVVLSLSACEGSSSNPPPADGSADGPAADTGPICFGSGDLIDPICFTAAEVAAFPEAPPMTIDTSACADVRSQGIGPDYCLVTAKNVTVSGTLRATGTRPLVLIGAQRVTVTGTLDVASYQSEPAIAGAGADDPASCLAPVGPIDGGPSGGGPQDAGGGGGGGGFRGRGGTGIGGVGLGADGGFGGPMRPLPGPFEAGCFGGAGGAGLQPGPRRSHGGGGVYVMAGIEITIGGTIAAWGAGGVGGTARAGGAGGGSGGMIALAAPRVTVGAGARLLATGGGGGEGGSPSVTGESGKDGDLSTPGITSACGHDGGVGGRTGGGDSGDLNGGGAGCAGGGGGGSAGWIFVFSAAKTLDAGATIAPPAAS